MTSAPNDDRRNSQRFSFYRHIQYVADGRRQQGLIQNLSVSGMRLLCTHAVARAGRQLLVTLPRSPRGNSSVTVKCEVAWQRSRAIGVRFVNPPSSLRGHLSALLSRSHDAGQDRGAESNPDAAISG